MTGDSDSLSPTPRSGHAMSYDSKRDLVVLYGGINETGMLSDTWTWNGKTWTEVTPRTNNPPARMGHGMAYDNTREKIVMFGGYNNSGRFADTWQWNGTRWENSTPSSGNPQARREHTLVYDNHNQRVVMFGGAGLLSIRDSEIFSDTWVWDGSRWSDMTPSGNNPYQRLGHASIYDSARAEVFIFGGLGAPNLNFSSGFVFNDTAWTRVTSTSQNPPSSNNYISTYYEPTNETMFLATNDLAQYGCGSRSGWRNQTSTLIPTAVAPFRLIYDASRKKAVLFASDSRSANRIGTWEWDGSTWVDVTVTNNNPTTRSGFHVAYDSQQYHVILFGQESSTSELSDIWRWNGNTRRWTRINSAVPGLSGNSYKIVYDSHRRVFVLFNGRETWHWDRNTWTRVQAHPDGLTPGLGPMIMTKAPQEH